VCDPIWHVSSVWDLTVLPAIWQRQHSHLYPIEAGGNVVVNCYIHVTLLTFTLLCGVGWAAGICFDERLRRQFDGFRRRVDTFSLGVCNGCQLMALLRWVGTDDHDDISSQGAGVPACVSVCLLLCQRTATDKSRVNSVRSKQQVPDSRYALSLCGLL